MEANLKAAIIYLRILTLENVGTVVNYYGVSYKIGSWFQCRIDYLFITPHWCLGKISYRAFPRMDILPMPDSVN
jgi:hypothetical protein